MSCTEFEDNLKAFSDQPHFLFKLLLLEKKKNWNKNHHLAAFARFLMSLKQRHRCWVMNVWPEIKSLSTQDRNLAKPKNKPKQNPPHTEKQGLSQNLLMLVQNAWNISSASPASANMLLCTLKRQVNCTHRSDVMSCTRQILNQAF